MMFFLFWENFVFNRWYMTSYMTDFDCRLFKGVLALSDFPVFLYVQKNRIENFKHLGDYLVDSKKFWCFGNRNEFPRDVFRFIRFWSTEPFGSPHQSSEVFEEIQGLVAFEQNVAGPGDARNYLDRSNTFLTHHLGPIIPMSIIARTPLKGSWQL